jgi:O-antigen/teichoic acid export membrane protein
VSDDHAGAKTELRRSFTLRVLAAIAGTVSTFALTIIVVRTLDARDTAAFFAILAALAIGSIVGKLGLGPNVIRLIPAEEDAQQRKVIAGTHLKAVIALTAPTAPIVAFCATFGLIGHGNFIPVLVLTASIIMLEAVRMMLSDIFAATGRVVASVLTMHYIRSALVVPVIALVAVLAERPTLVTVLAAYAAVSAVQLALALWFSRHDVSMSGSAGLSAVRAAVSSGTRLFSLDFSAFMMVSGSIWLANAAFDPETATLYSAAATIAMQVTILEGLTALAVTPPAARLWSAGRRHEVVRLLSNLATVNTAIIVVVIVVLMIGGGAALQLAYGPEMRSANPFLVILACGGILQGAFAVNISLLIIAGRINEVSRTALLVLCVVFPASVAAAYLGGPVPLAIVSASGLSLLSLCQWLTARRYMEEAPRPHRHLIHAVRDVVSETSGSGAAQNAD